MKFLSLVCLIALLFAPRTSDAIENLSSGIMVGGSWSTQSWSYDEGGEDLDPVDKGVFGLSGGAWVNLEITKAFALGVEAYYARRGFRSEGIATTTGNPTPTGTYTVTMDLYYLSVPVSGRYRIPAGSFTVVPMVGLGAEILAGKGDLWSPDDMGSIVIALHTGVGIERGRLGLNVRYVGDLTNAYDRPSDAVSSGLLDSIKNRSIVLFLSYALWE